MCQQTRAPLPEHSGIPNALLATPSPCRASLPSLLAWWETRGLMVITSPDSHLGNRLSKQTRRNQNSAICCISERFFGVPCGEILGQHCKPFSEQEELAQPWQGWCHPWQNQRPDSPRMSPKSLSGGTGNPTMGKLKPGESFVSAPSLQLKPKPTKHLFLCSLQEL